MDMFFFVMLALSDDSDDKRWQRQAAHTKKSKTKGKRQKQELIYHLAFLLFGILVVPSRARFLLRGLDFLLAYRGEEVLSALAADFIFLIRLLA